MLIHPAGFGHNIHWPKLGGCAESPSAGSPSRTVWPVSRLHAKWHLDPSSRLGTIDTAENWGGLCRFFEEVELGPHLTQCRLGRGLYLPTKWHLDPSSHLATTDMGRKFRELGSHLTQKSSGLRLTSIPSGILIYPAIWPRQIWAENWELCSFWGAGFPSNTM